MTNQHSIYAWLGFWRDQMPPQAVEQLQNILGPLQSPDEPKVKPALAGGGHNDSEGRSDAMVICPHCHGSVAIKPPHEEPEFDPDTIPECPRCQVQHWPQCPAVKSEANVLDATVRCRCGWQGGMSKLIYLDPVGESKGCPQCHAEFVPVHLRKRARHFDSSGQDGTEQC